ncbi:MAG: glycosyl transferase family 2 [Pseudonocardiales bacterium]|nr:glycosyl transferase family 2 [Pseudonocardiales bacterium]
MPAPAEHIPWPEGLRIAIGADVRTFDHGRTLLNRTSGRLLRVTSNAAAQIEALTLGAETSPAGRVLARRLLGAGLAGPVIDPVDSLADITVVIPVRDRPASLARCLTALGTSVGVVVVDDGSTDAPAVRRVCERHSAQYLQRVRNGGPAAARNTGLGQVTTPLVAFLDSDCVTDPTWLRALAGHFADPLLAAVAPRIVGLRPTPRAAPLDLGTQSSLVIPGGPVSYVPTAALLVRTSALADVGGVGAFDEALRYGEDVDLVWRLYDAGWWVRYEPSVTVAHDEPVAQRALLGRRFRYGTSAGPLARRHPGRLAPVRVSAPVLAAMALLFARRPVLAVVVYLLSVARLHRLLRRHQLPASQSVTLMARAFGYGSVGVARAANTLLPGLIVAVAIARRRPGLLVFGLLPLIQDWKAQRPAGNPLQWALNQSADQAAYGLGVWVGSLQARTVRSLLPRSNRLFR